MLKSFWSLSVNEQEWKNFECFLHSNSSCIIITTSKIIGTDEEALRINDSLAACSRSKVTILTPFWPLTLDFTHDSRETVAIAHGVTKIKSSSLTDRPHFWKNIFSFPAPSIGLSSRVALSVCALTLYHLLPRERTAAIRHYGTRWQLLTHAWKK